ncbi:MAG: CBS domain-containing protein [Nitrospirae bacterium]|nr:CBS domain-containing protein [Nitrospirota bacterium]MBI3593717.1 CBS domain-containing protein [Nitrospirota bacterium]
MMKLKEIMTTNPVKIEADKTVRDASILMAQVKLGSLLVCKRGEVIGILEESDIIRNVLAEDLNPYVTRVEKVMSIPFIIDEERSDNEASDMMNQHNVRHLAVSSNSTISGIVSMLDLIRPIYLGKSFWA